MWSELIILSAYIFVLIPGAAPQSPVETLPGYPGTLPFKLETGYISLGDDEEVQLFYYFIESEGDPDKDPLILWLTGGPGCSAFSGLVYEIGPLNFNLEDFDGRLPNFTINPYSWTKLASIIFVDSPVGTGFSYSTNPEIYLANDDTTSAYQNYIFLKKWLLSHPKFLKNRLYIAGDSFAGKTAPMVALLIAEGNEAGDQPRMQLQGYIVGNARTVAGQDENERIPYAHRMALVPDEYFELARTSCNGEYINVDPKNSQCTSALRFVTQDNNYITSYVWANDESVQEALHIKKGTKSEWTRCNNTLVYEEDVKSVLEHHRLLSDKGYHALVYSGDHDMVIPYMGTLRWIGDLNLTLYTTWRAWIVDGQVAGYTKTYKNNEAYLMFATVK